MKKIAILFLTLLSIVTQATPLGDAAAAMHPGTWKQFTGSNASLLVGQWTNQGHGYDDGNMAWNSKKRMILHTSADHGPYVNCDTFPNPPGVCWKALMSYSDDANLWTVGGAIPPKVGGWHGYDMFTWDDVNEVIYIAAYMSTQMYRYCVNNTPSWCSGKQGVWTPLPPAPSDRCCGIPAISYNPVLGGGTLLVYNGDSNGTGCGRLLGYRESSGWADVDSGAGCKFNAGDYNGVAEFSPIKQVSIFGGGGGNQTIFHAQRLWKVTAQGTVSQLTDSPYPISFGAHYSRQALPDPVTGDFLFLFGGSSDGGVSTTMAELWRLNPDGNGTWTQLDNDLRTVGKPCESSFIRPCPNDFFATTISTYNILLFWKLMPDSSAQVWLYKPDGASTSQPPPPPPPPPPAPTDTEAPSVSIISPGNDAVVDLRL
jgi:hypothetical protein